jgi:hypothetical protein
VRRLTPDVLQVSRMSASSEGEAMS